MSFTQRRGLSVINAMIVRQRDPLSGRLRPVRDVVSTRCYAMLRESSSYRVRSFEEDMMQRLVGGDVQVV
jgi:hypothetical protein